MSVNIHSCRVFISNYDTEQSFIISERGSSRFRIEKRYYDGVMNISSNMITTQTPNKIAEEFNGETDKFYKYGSWSECN